ncbi:hypothetical protein [Endozoicomonas euniceicola]|uniref:Uncharacterized protein n=1 Tax=Endozoicomonas euniceicola TaxID=1234143 RepID=A0ABY6GZZ0_9GAMM|nr:hypothetical protein [Endozoicomonas euniceicola]UYM17596.1 hypothetical protein NX720_06735 [Endozoicomonas euniceicola]
MNKQQILGLLLATYVYNCTAAPVTAEDYGKKVKAREICEANQFDYVAEDISPGSDLTFVIKQARHLPSRTKRAARQTDVSRSDSVESWYEIVHNSTITPSPHSANTDDGSDKPWYEIVHNSTITPSPHSANTDDGSDEPWYEIIHQSIMTPPSPSANSDSGSGSGSSSGSGSGSGSGSDEPWHEIIHQAIVATSSPHSAATTPTTHYDDDDEDFLTEHQATASGSGEADEYSTKMTPDGITPPRKVLLILPKSDTPYLMTGPIEINDYALKICSPSEENDGSEKSFADVKPATVKIKTKSETDAPPFFSVTEQGLLSMSGITLDAREVRIRSSLIYVDNSMALIDWSDIILTSLKSSQSHKSILGLKSGASDILLVNISNSRLYNGISEGQLSMIEPSTPGKLTAQARLSVSNSLAYVTENTTEFEEGSFTEITKRNFKTYTSASPDFYTHVMENCPNHPWYLMSKNDGYGNMLETIDDTSCLETYADGLYSASNSTQQGNNSAPNQGAGPLTLLITATALILAKNL